MIDRFPPLFDWARVRLAAGLSLLLLGSSAFAADAGGGPPPEGPPKNCIDRCIIEFAAKSKVKVSDADLAAAIDAVGLERAATFRSLNDCLRIMAVLGLRARAVPFVVEPASQYPPLSMMYITPNPELQMSGHVVVITSTNGKDLEIFDPATGEAPMRAKAEAATGIHETFAIIPETSYWATVARGLAYYLGLSVLIGLTIALPLVLYLKRRTGSVAPVSMKSGAVLLLAAISLGLAGCRRTATPSGVNVEESSHDFGVISGDSIPASVTHSFRLRNDSAESIVITPAASSCSCVLVAAKHDGIRLAPGEADELTVSIRLGQKNGPFRESVSLRTVPETVAAPRQLSLVGFVSRGPVPSATSIQFKAADGEARTSELEVVYPRRPGESAAKLVSSRIEGEAKARFRLDTPRQQVGSTVSATLADVWRIPVTYQRDGNSAQDRAEIRLQFDQPKCELTIALDGQRLSPVEPLGQGKVYLSGLAVGVAHEEKVFLRVRDQNSPGSVSVRCPPDIVSGSFDAKSRMLSLTIRPDRPGDFSRQVDILYEGRPVSKLDVLGSAN